MTNKLNTLDIDLHGVLFRVHETLNCISQTNIFITKLANFHLSFKKGNDYTFNLTKWMKIMISGATILDFEHLHTLDHFPTTSWKGLIWRLLSHSDGAGRDTKTPYRVV